MLTERDREYYEREYKKNKRSPQEIAEEWGTYPNKIRRELIKLGYKLRNKSQAQKNALEQGRHGHPTKGKARSEDVKIKISERLAKNWKDMNDDERARRSELGRIQWDLMTEEEKTIFRLLSLEAVRETSRDGSKMEKHLYNGLNKNGYQVMFHSEHILPGTRLQTDLYVPSHTTVIEIDGPSHFLPIWGQDSLDKNIEADNKKNNLLLTYGFVIIRVKCLVKTISEIHKRNVLKAVEKTLQDIKNSFPPIEKRLIEIEII